MKRWDFDRAVVASDLPPPVRHVLHVLAVVANWPGGVVPAEYTKSLTELARMTGMGRSTLARALNEAEHQPEHDPTREGWVIRQRPTKERARSAKERTQYRLRIPTASPRAGLVPERDQNSSPEAGPASPRAGLELVPERDGASPRAGHNPVLSRTTSSSSRRPKPVTAIAEALSIEEEEAEEIYTKISGDPRIGAPSRYVATLIDTGDITRYRPQRTSTVTPLVPTHDFVDNGTDFCDTCQMPRTHARHGGRK